RAARRDLAAHQHALRQEPLSSALEERRVVPRAAQFPVRVRPRSRRRCGGVDPRADVASGAGVAVEESPPRDGETARDSRAAARIRPRPRGVVPLRLAILGTRGVPPRYGGFETFAAELGTRLVERGHEVSVYCRARGDKTWNGIERIVLPAIRHKYFETVSHALLSAFDALRRGFDVILVCNAANAFVLPLLRAARIPVAINVDGIERRRRKWNLLGRMVYSIGESLSVLFAGRR